MSEIFYDLQTQLVKFTDQEKIAGKIDLKLKLISLNMPLLNNLQHEHCVYI